MMGENRVCEVKKLCDGAAGDCQSYAASTTSAQMTKLTKLVRHRTSTSLLNLHHSKGTVNTTGGL